MPAEISGIAGVDPPNIDAVVSAEQIRLLYHQRAIVPANLLTACAVVVVVWPLYQPWVLAGWVGLICVVIFARSLLRYHYQVDKPNLDRFYK